MNFRDIPGELRDALTPEGLDALLRHSVERKFATGEMLWTVGDRADGITLVLEGKVRILRGSGGRQLVIHWGEAGATLGEVPFFTAGSYPATAVAAEPTRVLVLTRGAVTRAIATDANLALFFLKRLSLRVQGLVDRVDHLTGNRVQMRVARFVLERFKASQKPARRSGGKSGAFSLGMTQTALAEELGTVREVIVRELRELKEAGAIEGAGDGKYRVGDLAILERLAEPAP